MSASTGALARLLEREAQTGPRILTLDQQRDAVRLLTDMAARMERVTMHDYDLDGMHKESICEACALLARFAALEERAAQ